ncbi:MAG: GldG family protein [Candidatus Zixiibacteriota bacterium]
MEVVALVREKFRFAVGSLATLLLVVAVLVVLNLISLNLFTRLDFTEGKVFTLSKASKDVVRNLNDRLLVKMYFTKDLPPPYGGYARYLKDQLEEYQAYAGGKMKLEMIDPDEEGKEMEAQRYGIPPMQVNAMENDKIEIKKVYMGVVFLFEDRKEVMPVVQNISGLEYDLTSIIKRLKTVILPSIGFATSEDETDLGTQLTYLNQELSRQYRVKRINLEEESIPPDLNVLIVLGPKKKFSDKAQYAIDQFLMRGGRVAFLLDQINADLQKGMAQKQDLGLDGLLNHYGIRVNDDLVVDLQCNRIAINQQQGGMVFQNVVNYPFFPAATDFDKNNLMVKGLGAVSFYFVSSLSPTVAASAKNLRFDPIIRSSKNSGSQVAPFDLNPFRKLTREDFGQSGLILATTVQGNFKSYFSDKGKPSGEAVVGASESTLTSSPQTRLVVVGDADFVMDQNIRGTDNGAFFLNMVDWLAQDEALIAIRSKQVNPRPLKEVSSGTKRLAKYGNTLGLPLVVILFGVARWQMRRRLRRKDVLLP